MGSNFYRVKIGLYVLVVLIVGMLFAVRVHNVLQKTDYLTETIFQDRDVRILLHYPAEVLSPKNDISYPLIVSFYYMGNATVSHTYEILLRSPTLLFVDAKGVEVLPRFQFVSDDVFIERSVYVRPPLSATYPQQHWIAFQIIVDGKVGKMQPAPIEIHTEAEWFSFLSLTATSLLEISIASALITWIINAIDASLATQKERVAKIREKLSGLSSMSYLERMEEVRKLEGEAIKEHLDGDLKDEIDRAKNQFKKEEEFFRALGEQLQRGRDGAIDFKTIQELHNFFYPQSNYKLCVGALGEILQKDSLSPEKALSLLTDIYRLWDDLDADVRDLIVGALRKLSSRVDLRTISTADLLKSAFRSSIPDKPNHRRRLLRNPEIQRMLPQLVDPETGKSNPLGYDANWLHSSGPASDSKALAWLKKFDLVSNPFSVMDLKNYPFYPEGFVPPDHWMNFLTSVPHIAQCPTSEDAKALAYYLRAKCLPVRVMDANAEEIIENNQQIFPIWVSLNQSATIEAPLLVIARSAAQAWLDILCLSPDALLDLSLAEQEALFDLFSWAFDSTNTFSNLLRQGRIKADKSSGLLVQKIEQFRSRFSSVQVPQDPILLSWLRIKPPDLHSSYLIIPLDEIPVTVKGWWLEQFNSLISRLFLNGIVTKAFSSLNVSRTLSLSKIYLHWSNSQLKMSLNSQFDLATDKSEQDMGKVIDFRSLFGADPSIGYFETEEDTTEKLISASHNSLARMLTLGNRLLQYHCENRTKDGVPEKYLYIEDLETILNSA
ncbi:MAG: hypothetical protein QY329_13895 [Anaerolineales bacterium]|nr:MAG: hypothetical protein QY329_13895 [Anaerolineales bacterium]